MIIRGWIGGTRSAIVFAQRVFHEPHNIFMSPMIEVDVSPYFGWRDIVFLYDAITA
jgi:hypothetical protein